MLPKDWDCLGFGEVSVSLVLASCLGLMTVAGAFEISEYQPPGGDPPSGGSTTTALQT